MLKIQTNSKKVKKNDIFICIHNNLEDRHDFIEEVIKKKPCCIIVDKDINIKTKIPIIKVNNTNDTIYQILKNYYNYHLNEIKLIGITGTDGKTTTAIVARELLNYFDRTTYLGTNGFYIDNKKYNTKNTTPALEDIFYYINETKNNNNNNLIMEISSEGLIRNRCHNLIFDYCILTNITQDHLNVHKTIFEYVKSKSKLFKQVNSNTINILNIDDKYFNYIKKASNKNIITYGTNKKADFYFYNIKENDQNTTFELLVNNKVYNITSPLRGKFNVYNLVAAIALVSCFNINIDSIIEKIKDLKQVTGRMHYLDFKQNYTIILDYAHTINATKEILEYVNKIKKNNIITVVGCAGSRDTTKRNDIGKLVSKYSDHVIFTADDPRYEDPKQIIDEMTKGIDNNYDIITNRKKAIIRALKLAKENDIVLVLGKGLDNYMAIKNKYKKYSDYKIIKNYFSL